MKKYVNPTICVVTVDCNALMAVSVLDGFADSNSDILVKEEDLLSTDLFGNETFGAGEDFGNESWGGLEEL